MKGQRGALLVEAVVALALLGIVGASFLGGVATTSRSRVTADEHVSARIIAESQMEDLKKQTYAFSYNPIPVAPDYPGYFAVVQVENLRNGNIQKITVTVRHHNADITSLQSYKVNR